MIRTSCTVREEDLEDAYDILLPALPQGVHERPAGDGRAELSWFGVGRLDLGGLAADWREEEAAADHRAYAPVHLIAGRLVVRAPETPPGPPGVPEVVIASDRGQFGTGAHPTTRDSLELLLSLPAEGSFADLGCGAGVLAVAAATLGFDPVVAVDVEPGSVRITEENARRNGVAVRAAEADLTSVDPPRARTVAANVPPAVHRRLGPGMRAERVIVSGFVSEDAAGVLAAYAGYATRGRRDTAGWTTALLERA